MQMNGKRRQSVSQVVSRHGGIKIMEWKIKIRIGSEFSKGFALIRRTPRIKARAMASWQGPVKANDERKDKIDLKKRGEWKGVPPRSCL